MAFLGPNDFIGSYQPRRSNAKIAGQSTYHGKVVFTNIARDIVEEVLPQDLRLADKKVATTPDLHPMIYMYGHQTNTDWVIYGRKIPVGRDYQELILIIPFVQNVNGEKWHNYILRIYLNDTAALILGNKFFGYAKHDATFDETNAGFTVLEDGRPTFRATIKSLGTWQTSKDAEQTLPNYRDIQTIFEMPVLGVKEERRKLIFICSYFEWKYDAVEVAPVRSEHQFLLSGSLISVPEGAIAIRNLQWRLDHPPPPRCQF